MTIEIEETLNELDEQILDAIREEDLHTYADIAEEIGESVNKIFDHLKAMVRRDMLVEAPGPPNQYYIRGTWHEGIKKTDFPNTRRQLGSKPPKTFPCPKCGKPMKLATSQQCRSCFTSKSKKSVEKVAGNGDQTTSPAARASRTNSQDDVKGMVAASEGEASRKELETPKAVEGPDAFADNHEHCIACGHHRSWHESDRDVGGKCVVKDCACVLTYKDGQSWSTKGGTVLAPIPVEPIVEPPQSAEYEVDTATGAVAIFIYCDLFKAPPIERDLIEGIIQLVQAYEGKKIE